jgi:hypothetical protein
MQLSVTYANNCPANMRHIAPMLDEDNVYDGIAQTVWLTLAENMDQEINSSPLSNSRRQGWNHCYLSNIQIAQNLKTLKSSCPTYYIG